MKRIERVRESVTCWLDGLPPYVWVPALPFAWAALAILYVVYCITAPAIVAVALAVQFVRWLCGRRRKSDRPPTLFDGTDLLK